MNSIAAGRPAKRVRQACEPCRRKKAKCPGEQPTCSLCARLQQQCMYAEERRISLTNGLVPTESAPIPTTPEHRVSKVLEDRLGSLEAKMGEVLDALGRNGARAEQAPTNPSIPNPLGFSAASSLPFGQLTPLPTWENVLSIAQLYLLYCDSQPLPLFHKETFLSTLGNRDPEVVYAVLALGVRFAEDQYRDANDLASRINGYTEVARGLVMKRISEGPVELSTLQCLCLLSLVDFTNGNTHRSSIHSSLAMNLAQCANLASEPHVALLPTAREERRRCFWSICLLKRLHSIEFDDLDLPDGSFPPYPGSPTMPQSRSPNEVTDGTRNTDLKDQGIVAYVIMLSEVFAKTAKYVRRHGRPTSVPPWSSQSEYSRIIALQMDLETRVPYIHRFKPASLSERTLEELQANRDYWGPFFLNQVLYHTILCLLNHPLLLSLSLRNFRSTIPEIFLQHTSDLISSHTTWIIHFIKYFEEKSFLVSDPFLGYSAAVVATIELQLSFTENTTIREEKRDRFFKCVGFVQGLGKLWPHMARLADRLQRLEDAVSASYQPESGAQNKSLLIDLSRFWEILEYSSSSDSDSARRMFGDSLYSESPAFANEVSRTSPLPEPTRLISQQGISHSPASQYGLHTSIPMNHQYTVDSGTSLRPPDLLDDEFSILATNFFSQGQEFLRSCDNRESIGNF
ncbi:fungal-specific transcription factor domain-containing protein [Aspergillus avenaceus]|uniref:Fungal-specific transcription factor domain-containing protein n=1 Tax=Aspergillus avenaceus TaxID=36643 RepID=A0A5N6TRP4_ASPAV|nr:fungal-specific transcription factor domain-containing protein [Aspergillus avenaceus]